MKIENFEKTDGTTKVVAFFDIVIDNWDLTLRHWKLIDGKHGQFVASPSFRKSDDSFASTVSFSKDKEKGFQENVLKALAPLIAENNEALSEANYF